jgi:hypothetical protein
MATEWFYTTNKTQMGPVSWKELHELAEVGILKPHDLVWTEGMDEWVKAINQQGLFTDDADEKVTSSGKKAAYAETKPPPGRRTRRREDEEEEDDEEDSKEKKRKARKREEDRARTGVGIKVALILGAVVFVLLLMVCGGVGLVWLAMSRDGRKDVPQAQGNNPPPNVNPAPGPAPKPANVQTYTVQNLFQGQRNERTFQFQQGRRVIITSNNNLAFPDTDVDLFVFRRNQANAIAADTEVPQRDRNCRVEFIVPATDTYVIRLVNLGPGMARACNVTIEER